MFIGQTVKKYRLAIPAIKQQELSKINVKNHDSVTLADTFWNVFFPGKFKLS